MGRVETRGDWSEVPGLAWLPLTSVGDSLDNSEIL